MRTPQFQAAGIVKNFLNELQGIGVAEFRGFHGAFGAAEGTGKLFFVPRQSHAGAVRDVGVRSVGREPKLAGQLETQALAGGAYGGRARVRGGVQIAERFDKFQRREAGGFRRDADGAPDLRLPLRVRGARAETPGGR